MSGVPRAVVWRTGRQERKTLEENLEESAGEHWGEECEQAEAVGQGAAGAASTSSVPEWPRTQIELESWYKLSSEQKELMVPVNH